MSFFKWTNALVIGVDAMDAEHQELVDLMNKLYLLSSEDKPKLDIETAFKNLISFTQKHFSDEEEFMTSIHYPDIERHKRAHVDLLSRLEDEFHKFHHSDRVFLEEGFFAFLQFWLKTHIQGNDVKYGYFAKQKV